MNGKVITRCKTRVCCPSIFHIDVPLLSYFGVGIIILSIILFVVFFLLVESDKSSPGSATLADNQSSSSKQVQEASGKVPSEQAYVTNYDIDAAKIAAMKAAELVNEKLVGTGYMSTDQKNTLLWDIKKNTTTEESVYHWDTTTFGDRERQEKFNKLMGVKGDTKVEQKQDNHNVEKQREQLQLDLEKQYTAGLRWRNGRTVGLGL